MRLIQGIEGKKSEITQLNCDMANVFNGYFVDVVILIRIYFSLKVIIMLCNVQMKNCK